MIFNTKKYPEQLTPELAYHIGRAISTYLTPEQIIGRDMRISSGLVYKELISGFLKSAINVVDIGLTSTDVFVPESIKPMKIIADSGNGMAGPISSQVYLRLT